MVLCIILHTCVLDDTQEHHLSVLKLLHVSYVLYVFCIGCFRTLLTCSTNKTLHVLNLNTGVLLHSLNTSNMFWKCYILVFYLVFYSGTLIFRLGQSHLPITCDEGVCHIAIAIIMNNPTEFSNLVLCLRSFHLIMGAIGKYIEGSGAEIILAE